MDNLEKLRSKVQRVSREYYELIGKDHHKDRDCHFYINCVFSYGESPFWRIEHYGYISSLPKYLERKKFLREDEALNSLLDFLNSAISTQKQYNENNNNR